MLKGLIGEFGYPHKQVDVFCDLERAITLSKNNIHHERMKHVSLKYQFIRENIEEDSIKVSKISKLHNPAVAS